MNKFAQILQKTIFYCSVLLMFVPLIVVKYSFFPFVFYKGIAILFFIEIIFVAYLVLALLKPAVRPKLNWLNGSIIIFGLISFITSITGASFNRSWWGDWERFEGTYLLFHFIAWLLILSWTMAESKQWRKLFVASVFASFLVSIIGLLQFLGFHPSFLPDVARISSTLGNAAYLASYALISMFLSFYCYFAAQQSKFKIFFLLAAVLNALTIILSGTRGTAIALAVSVLAYMVFYLFNRKILVDIRHKIFFRISLSLGVIAIILLVLSTSGVFKNNYYLSRFFNLNFESNTIQTRFQAWQYGLEGFKDHFWLGVGPENYNLVFDQYLQPVMYKISGDEIWFSRSHNKIIDVAVMTGIFGLLAYLSIFGIALVYLRKFYKQGVIGIDHYLVISILLIGYFVSNLFLFDVQATYLLFFLLLAYLSSCADFKAINLKTSVQEASRQGRKVLVILISLVSLVILTGFAWLNSRFVQANYYLLKGVLAGYRLEFNGFVDNFEKAIAITPSFIQPVNLYAVNFNENLGQITVQEKDKDFFKNAMERLLVWQKKVNYLDPKNVYNHFQELKTLGNLYDLMQDDKYLDLMDGVVREAIVYSPNNIRLYWTQFNYYFQRNDFAKQKEILEKAIAIAPEVGNTYWFQALMYFHQKMEDEGFISTDKAIDFGYNFKLNSDIQMILPHYIKANDFKRTVFLLNRMIELLPDQNETYFELAEVYAAMGEYDQAVAILKKLASYNPTMTDNVIQYIQSLTNMKPYENE